MESGLLTTRLYPPVSPNFCVTRIRISQDTPAPEGYDLFHTLILLDELARSSADSASILSTGYIIGGNPVRQFASESLKKKVQSCGHVGS